MTKRDLEKLGKSLLPDLPGFAVKSQLLFIQPIGHTLRAVCFDGSGFDADLFFVHVFLQPLFVPAKDVVLNLGWRIGGSCHRWNIKTPHLQGDLGAALKREALPFLGRIGSPQDVVAVVESLHISADPVASQAIAYSIARSGDVDLACQALGRFIRLVKPTGYWSEEIRRAETLKSQLLTDSAAAQEQLDAWETESIRNLGLEKFR